MTKAQAATAERKQAAAAVQEGKRREDLKGEALAALRRVKNTLEVWGRSLSQSSDDLDRARNVYRLITAGLFIMGDYEY